MRRRRAARVYVHLVADLDTTTSVTEDLVVGKGLEHFHRRDARVYHAKATAPQGHVGLLTVPYQDGANGSVVRQVVRFKLTQVQIVCPIVAVAVLAVVGAYARQLLAVLVCNEYQRAVAGRHGCMGLLPDID